MRSAATRPDEADAPAILTRVLLVLALLLAIRILALSFNRTDLFFDEAQYWHWGKEPAFGYYSKPPLIAWIIGLATSFCGDSTFCIRLPAPLLHTATALVLYAIGHRFLTPAVGAWAAIGFATLPGVSLSSGIISTDVPLLLCWALALLAYLNLQQSRNWWPALLLGLAFGAGLNAKYAMAFFPACIAVHLALTPASRPLLRDPRLWVALALGLLLIAPNMAWNHANSFATFSHTADNAKWGGALLNVGKGLEFAAAQLGVFGPILFVALLALAARAWREGLPETERLLLFFTAPVLLAITAQAFVSRAHANWAATAYVAGALLVSAVLVRTAADLWLRRSLALHMPVAAALAVAPAFAGKFTVPLAGDPYQRTLGWKELAIETEAQLGRARRAGKPFAAVFADERAITAELLYYLRHDPTPILAWRDGPRPRDHYELTRPLVDPRHAPALLISLKRDAAPITRRFADVQDLGEKHIPAGLGPARSVRFYALSGLRPQAPSPSSKKEKTP